MSRKRDTVKLVLRLPPQLHRLLRRAAAKNKQSLNSEMIRRLDDSFGMVARMGGKRFRWISEDTFEEEP